ncbi:MAG: DEAD/DEAH box helicase family protein [Clostridia bacterium]|nr:DEAD/DEAH box helicase family protein [Clostridia bacterium]
MITIIDAPCGTGKTSWAIQEMNRHPEKPFVYCTPFLDEIQRVRISCGKERFKEPLPYTGTKIDDFNDLLSQNVNICVTHSTFLNSTEETLQAIHEGGYTLILDECLDVVQPFNSISTVEDVPRQQMSKNDVKWLLTNGVITIGDDSKVTWCGGTAGNDFKFSEAQRLACAGRLYCVNGTFLVTIFPPEIFTAFDEVFAMTYCFDGYTMKYYLIMFNLGYELRSIANDNGLYSLVPYNPDADYVFREKCAELIGFCSEDKLNQPETRSLARNWFEKASKDDLKSLRNQLAHFYRRYLKSKNVKAADIMWTTLKPYDKDLKGAGYTQTASITKKEREKLSSSEIERLEKQYSCFVPCNARATNDFKDRWALAYCLNLYQNRYIIRFFKDNAVDIDEDAYTIANLVQWLCRSRLRKGKAIELYMPSLRMRKLLSKWLKV